MQAKSNITFEMDSFNRNKILTGGASISEKIFYILNAKDPEYPGLSGLPRLIDNFKKRYADKAEVENEVMLALNQFLEPDIIISAVVYQEDTGILAVFIESLEDPITMKIEDTGLSRLNI